MSDLEYRNIALLAAHSTTRVADRDWLRGVLADYRTALLTEDVITEISRIRACAG